MTEKGRIEPFGGHDLNVGSWHIADDVLTALKVRYGVGSSAATYLGERPESGRVSDAGPARAIDPV